MSIAVKLLTISEASRRTGCCDLRTFRNRFIIPGTLQLIALPNSRYMIREADLERVINGTASVKPKKLAGEMEGR